MDRERIAVRPQTALLYDLRSVATTATVLHIGAHPDDEDSGLVALLARGCGARTVYWSATRGEGGQNRTGDASGDALGIVRTWESLAARGIDGAEVLYGPFRDFGYSKSGVDTLERWGRADLVLEIVRAIRAVQPHVVICRWSGDAEDGHGHHQAVGMVAAEAFELAADGTALPEGLVGGLPPWRAPKLYRSVGGDWQPGEGVAVGVLDQALDRDGIVRVNTGAYDAVSGRTFQELATLGLNRHETQGMALVPEPGDHLLYYRLERSLVPVPSREETLFDGLDTSLEGLADLAGPPGERAVRAALAAAGAHASAALESLDPRDPVPAGHSLLRALGHLRAARAAVPGEPGARALAMNLDRRIRAAERAAARCLGLRLEALVDGARVTPGQRLGLRVRLWSHSREQVDKEDVDIHMPAGWQALRLVREAPQGEHAPRLAVDGEIEVPPDAELSCPYWLREPHGPARYAWPDTPVVGDALDPPVVSVSASLEIAGTRLTLDAPVVAREAFIGGTRELPLAVVPPSAIVPRSWVQLVPVAGTRQQLDIVATARVLGGAEAGRLALRSPEGWQVSPQWVELGQRADSAVQTVTFTVAVPPGTAEGTHDLEYCLRVGERDYTVALETVRTGSGGRGADEATATAETHVTRPARVQVHSVDVAFVESLRYAYVKGTGVDLAAALARFPVGLDDLSDEVLAYGDLSAYEAILVGPGAYLVRPELHRRAGRLLEYVEGGGTLIVLYQAYGYDVEGLAPYPVRHGRPHVRVTAADAPVDLLDPEHPVFRIPNRITARDFDGWVVERGRYLFETWDRRYVPLLATHDPGEQPQLGGFVTAGYGHGTYAYVALTLDRQVGAGVAGGVRLLANLLGLAEGRILERREAIRNVPLFSRMSDDHLYEIARLLSERWVDPDGVLCRQGTPGEELFVVLAGEMEVVREDGGGGQVVGRAGPGEVLGELAILTDEPRSATLRAPDGARLLAMRGGDFLRLMETHPDITHQVVRVLGRRLAAALRAPS